jgi:hypothetical protein
MRICVKTNDGPPHELTLEEVNEKLAKGTFDGSELAWTPGLTQWTALESIPGAVRPQPPPLPTVSPPTQVHQLALNVTSPRQPSHHRDELLQSYFESNEVTAWRKFFLAAHSQAWRRLWARLIDLGLTRLFLELALLALLQTTDFDPPPIAGLTWFVGAPRA